MKKFFLLFFSFFITINLSFSQDISIDNINNFKKDAETVLYRVLYQPNIIDGQSNIGYADYLLKDSLNVYEKFKADKKNVSNNKIYLQRISDNANNINVIDVYTPLSELLQKYNLPENDGNSNTYDFIYDNYLKKYDVPRSITYINFVHGLYDKQTTMLQMIEDIEKYTNKPQPVKSEILPVQTEMFDNTHVPAAQLEAENYTNEENENTNKPSLFKNSELCSEIFGIFIIIFLVCLYSLPASVAISLKHKNADAIFVLNLFLGWTFIGWVGALVWALCKSTKENPIIIKQENTSQIKELEKLVELKEKGILTEEEFNIQKAKLLNDV